MCQCVCMCALEREIVFESHCENTLQSLAVPMGCNLTLKLPINTLSNLFFSVVSHFNQPFVALVPQLSILFNVVHSAQ